MSECLSTDAILAIGEALNWDVSEGLRHLHACEECRAQIEVLRLTRSGFAETEPVDSEVLRRISAAIRAAAMDEGKQVRARERWVQSAEAFLAGVTALVILVSSDIHIESISAAAFGFVLGAVLMVCGKALARRVPSAGSGASHV